MKRGESASVPQGKKILKLFIRRFSLILVTFFLVAGAIGFSPLLNRLANNEAIAQTTSNPQLWCIGASCLITPDPTGIMPSSTVTQPSPTRTQPSPTRTQTSPTRTQTSPNPTSASQATPTTDPCIAEAQSIASAANNREGNNRNKNNSGFLGGLFDFLNNFIKLIQQILGIYQQPLPTTQPIPTTAPTSPTTSTAPTSPTTSTAPTSPTTSPCNPTATPAPQPTSTIAPTPTNAPTPTVVLQPTATQAVSPTQVISPTEVQVSIKPTSPIVPTIDPCATGAATQASAAAERKESNVGGLFEFLNNLIKLIQQILGLSQNNQPTPTTLPCPTTQQPTSPISPTLPITDPCILEKQAQEFKTGNNRPEIIKLIDELIKKIEQLLGISSTCNETNPALVQKNHKVGENPSTQVTFKENVTKGNLILVGVTQWAGKVSSVSDNKGNSYKLVAAKRATQNNDYVHLYYAKNVNGGPTTVTVKFTAWTDYTVGAYEYSGLSKTAPLDKVVSKNGRSTTPDGGNLKVDVDNELYFVVGVDDWANNSTPKAGSGYKLHHIQKDSYNNERYYSQSRVSPKGSYKTNFSIGTYSYWAVVGATFK